MANVPVLINLLFNLYQTDIIDKIKQLSIHYNQHAIECYYPMLQKIEVIIRAGICKRFIPMAMFEVQKFQLQDHWSQQVSYSMFEWRNLHKWKLVQRKWHYLYRHLRHY